MKYVNEYAVLLDAHENILAGVAGGVGHVNFPPELIWRFHKLHPGIIYCLMHMHPPGATRASGEDISTLEAMAKALAPFPARVGVVSEIEKWRFEVTVYLGLYQSKEDYLLKKQTGKRTFELVAERNFVLEYGEHEDAYSWLDVILQKSYETGE